MGYALGITARKPPNIYDSIQLLVFLNHAIPIMATVMAAKAAAGLMLCSAV